MRTIKFRAWDKGAKQMYSWDSIKEFFNEHIEHHMVEIMQYTGLKDKNGVEIYEGDILSVYEVGDVGSLEYKSPVEYIDSGFLVTEPGDCQVPLVLFHGTEDSYPLFEIEVVGNIYENPELLKVGDPVEQRD